jgi:hypothetical protein
MFAPIRFPTPPARRTRVTEDGSTTDDDEEEEDADTYLIGFALFPNTRRVLLFVFDAKDDDEEMENRDARTEEEIMMIARCVPYSSYSLRFALDERVSERERERWKVWSYRYLFYPLFNLETAFVKTHARKHHHHVRFTFFFVVLRASTASASSRGGAFGEKDVRRRRLFFVFISLLRQRGKRRRSFDDAKNEKKKTNAKNESERGSETEPESNAHLRPPTPAVEALARRRAERGVAAGVVSIRHGGDWENFNVRTQSRLVGDVRGASARPAGDRERGSGGPDETDIDRPDIKSRVDFGRESARGFTDDENVPSRVRARRDDVGGDQVFGQVTEGRVLKGR